MGHCKRHHFLHYYPPPFMQEKGRYKAQVLNLNIYSSKDRLYPGLDPKFHGWSTAHLAFPSPPEVQFAPKSQEFHQYWKRCSTGVYRCRGKIAEHLAHFLLAQAEVELYILPNVGKNTRCKQPLVAGSSSYLQCYHLQIQSQHGTV